MQTLTACWVLALTGVLRKNICPLCPSVLCCVYARKIRDVAIPNAVQKQNALDEWKPYKNSKRRAWERGQRSREQGTKGHCTQCSQSSCVVFSPRDTYPAPEDLVDGCTFFQCALGHHLRSHLLHIQHECIKGLLYVGLFLLFFLFGVLMLSGWIETKGDGHMPSNTQAHSSFPPKQSPCSFLLPTRAWRQFRMKSLLAFRPSHPRT